MNFNNVFKFVFIILILAFCFLMIASKSGYYEYELSRENKLTEEAIKRFEADVSEGKSIDIKNYIDSKDKNYNNKVSNLGKKVSDTIGNTISKTFDYIFKYLNKQTQN